MHVSSPRTLQLSYHGLMELSARVPENGLCVLFRNNHFSVLHKRKGALLLLLTDQGFAHTGAVWVSSNHGELSISRSSFRNRAKRI
jgi:hypothetical protein